MATTESAWGTAHWVAAIVSALLLHSWVTTLVWHLLHRWHVWHILHIWRSRWASIRRSGKACHATLCHDSRVTSRSATTQTRHILRKIVIAAAFITALPVSSAERNGATTAARAAATHTTVATTVHVTAHHSGVTKASSAIWSGLHAIGLAIRVRCRRPHRWEGATEARRAALKVGEATARACPVTRSRSILGWWKWRKKWWSSRWLRVCCTVKYPT